MTFLILALIFNAICDAVIFNDSFARFGKWFSRSQISEGRDLIYAWLRVKYHLPIWLCKFLSYDVLIIFGDLWHFSKFLMIGCFCFAISIENGFYLWMAYSVLFSPVYTLVKKVSL